MNLNTYGFTGCTHSESSKELISNSLKNYWKSLTDEQIFQRILKQLKTKERNGTMYNPRTKCSWKQGWREIGDKRKYFRSRWEANYARYLEFLKLNGDIKEWYHEPKTFWFDGIKRGTTNYLPDFQVIFNDGHEEYHEVKGWMDDKSKTKINRMRIYHPSVILVVIDSKEYNKIEKVFKCLIDDWELKL